MRFRLIFFCLWLLCSIGAMAQVVLTPIQQEVRQQEHIGMPADKRLNLTPVPLPFFDDFSASALSPDPSRWVNGGVYINNRFGLNPVTKNVASFDGLKASGKPYAPGAVAAGPADTLTSQPLLLGGLNPGDSVYLSFYWQSGGLGDVPDRTSSNTVYLQLEFKDVSGSWQPVWRQAGVGVVTAFAQVFIAVREQRFLHNNFQFRFRSVGQQSGMLDVWNVDYVELDKNRRKGQVTTRDIAISRSVSRLLKNYTAMPLQQFLEHPEEALSEEVNATLNNLGNFPGAISWRGFIKRTGAARADTFLVAQGLIPSLAREYEIKGIPRISNLALPGEHFTVQHGFILDTREQNLRQRANDSTSRKTVFADYYAFDDGSAEGGFNYNATGTSQVAQRVVLNRPDQVRGFRVHFLQVGNGLPGTSLALRIWDEENGRPGRVLRQESFQINYSTELNGFYEVIFSNPVNVSDAFYIGWSQPGNLFVNIGFDRNEQVQGRFLWSTANGWQADTFKGAVMLRPLMTGMALGIEEELAQKAIQLFPNPSSGEVFIEGEYKALRVYDITGREVYTHHYTVGASGKPLYLKHLASGAYTARIETNKTVISKKLILTKQW